MKTDCRTKTIFCFIFVIIVLGGTLFIIYPPVVNSVRKINAFEKGAVFLDLGQQYWFGDGKKQDYALAVFNFKLAAEKGNAQAALFWAMHSCMGKV